MTEQRAEYTMDQEEVNMGESKVLQIIPGGGWLAGASDGYYPVVCWALVERPDGSREVVGMVDSGEPSLCFVEDGLDFRRYYVPEEFR